MAHRSSPIAIAHPRANNTHTILAMGFNPFRRHQRSTLDVAIMIATLVVAAALVVWAVTGG